MMSTQSQEETCLAHERRWSSNTAGELLHEVTLLAWLSHGLAVRGEFLHAQQHLGAAVDGLLRMLKRHAGADGYLRICEQMPRRRLHAIAPDLARELLALLLGAIERPAARLLEIAEHRLRPRTPELDWREVADLRARMCV